MARIYRHQDHGRATNKISVQNAYILIFSTKPYGVIIHMSHHRVWSRNKINP